MARLFHVLILFFAWTISSDAAEMKRLAGDHFIVLYQGDETLAREVLHKAERFYSSILFNLGQDRLQEPWLGEKRCKILLYQDKDAFQKKTKGAQWAEGLANYSTHEIYSYNSSPDMMNVTLPHEIAHMVFRQIVGAGDNIPLWLDEGIALSQETGRRDAFYSIARSAMEAGTPMPFEKMDAMRSAAKLDQAQASIFYAQSTVTVNFLIESLGKKRFQKFCQLLREGQSVQEALKRVYGTDRIRSLKELQEKVQEYIGA